MVGIERREPIGFKTPGEDLVPVLSYGELADFVDRLINPLHEDMEFLTKDGSSQVAPDLISLIGQDTSMVVTLEKDGKTDPTERKPIGVGIAIPQNVYDPLEGDPNVALNYIFALAKDKEFSRKRKNDAADLLALMKHRIKIRRFTGGLAIAPVFTNLKTKQINKLLS